MNEFRDQIDADSTQFCNALNNAANGKVAPMRSALASILFGAFGWFVTHFMVEPMKAILDLRREAQECLIVHGNLAKDAPADDRRAASDKFRGIGAGLVSRHIAGFPWVRWCCTRLGYDIHSAGYLLIRLGNSTQFEGYSLANLSPMVVHIRDCLNLPTPKTPARVQALDEHAGRPGSTEDQL